MNTNDVNGGSSAIEVALATLSKESSTKEGVDLTEIAKKLSDRKFGKSK